MTLMALFLLIINKCEELMHECLTLFFFVPFLILALAARFVSLILLLAMLLLLLLFQYTKYEIVELLPFILLLSCPPLYPVNSAYKAIDR